MGKGYIRGFAMAVIWTIIAIIEFSAGRTTGGSILVGLAVISFIVGLVLWWRSHPKGATPK